MENTTASLLTTILSGHVVNSIQFSWYDYLLFSFMLGLSALIGIYFGCFGSKQGTTNEYLMGDKKMKVFPISVSLVASHISGITLLAVPADIYRFGAAYWLFVPSLIFVAIITIYVFLPVFYKLQITSTYEYLERRFDSKNRSFASFLFTLGLFLYLPIVIYIPALAFSAATGINVHLITPVVCGVCIFYTTIGGLKAVVWTDTLQFIVTVGAVITVSFLGVRSAGGFQAVWWKAVEGHRLDVFDFDPDPTKRDSFWIVIIGISLGWLSMAGIHQSCVQKFLSVPTLREAKLTVVYFSIGIAVIGSFSVFTGLIMYSKYASCDPFSTGAVKRNDQLLPYYIMDVASHIPGLSGLFIAGIFCAALSTLSASLNCLAGTLFEDFILKYIGGNISEQTSAHFLRGIVVVIGIICTALVFIIEHLGGILPLAISLGGVTAGPLLGMFTLGVLFPKASSKGTFYGAVFAMLFASWIVVMAQYYKAQGFLNYESKPFSTDGCVDNENMTSHSYSTPVPNNFNFTDLSNSTILFSSVDKNYKPFYLFRISFYYYTPLGALVTVITGLLISYFSENEDPPVHRDLLSPVIYPFLSPQQLGEKETVDYYGIDKALHLVTVNSDIGKTEKEQNY